MKGLSKEVNISLVADVTKGDYLLLHSGAAIERIEAQKFGETRAAFLSLRAALEGEDELF